MFTSVFDVVYHTITVHWPPFFTPSQLNRSSLCHMEETHRSIDRHLSPPPMNTIVSTNNYSPLQINILYLHTYLLPWWTQQQLRKTHTPTPEHYLSKYNLQRWWYFLSPSHLNSNIQTFFPLPHFHVTITQIFFNKLPNFIKDSVVILGAFVFGSFFVFLQNQHLFMTIPLSWGLFKEALASNFPNRDLFVAEMTI